jgi:hypothetical protein
MIHLRAIAACCALLASGCATRLYDPKTGQKTFESYANMSNVKVAPGTLEAERIDHSTPTRAALNGGTSAITALGAAAGAVGGL